MTWRIVACAIAVIAVIAYAGLSGVWVSTDQGWYLSLEKPWWQPPPVVFGLIWPYNFAALIAVGIVVALNAAPGKVAAFLALLVLSIVFAVTWAYLFYVPHSLAAAAVSLTVAALVTVPITVIAFSERWWAGALLVPYQIWLCLAASLSWGYVALQGPAT